MTLGDHPFFMTKRNRRIFHLLFPILHFLFPFLLHFNKLTSILLFLYTPSPTFAPETNPVEMRKLCLTSILFCVVIFMPLAAQVIKGKVVDTSGDPVPNASIYIRELLQGIMTDDNGEFQASLKKGDYTFEFSSLGYERKTIPLSIKEKPLSPLQVILDKKVYTLKEVIVSAKREDPAYEVMRKAISMAPFYLHQVKQYESEVYLKGTVKVEKIPRLLKIQSGAQELKEIENKLFLIESQNEVSFRAPNTYEQHVIAASSNVPTDLDAAKAMDIVTANIYAPDAMGRISPLSTNAFSFYTFTFEGINSEGGHLINKIRVQPKKKNPKLVTGWLYIIENTWNVHSVDLSATELGVTLRFTATYNEVKPSAFLPTAYDMDVKVDMMGVKASGKYYSSIQYKKVELNETLSPIHPQRKPSQPAPAEKPKTKKQQKAEQQLQTLAAKEQLTNREAYKMAKLMEQAVEPEGHKREKQSLELLPGGSNVRITVDTLAQFRDSLYWTDVRSLPLRPEEIESYKDKDSLLLKDESGQASITVDIGHSSSRHSLLSGGRISMGKHTHLSYKGLPGIVPEYNFVDGVWLGQRLTLESRLSPTKRLSLSPSVYYVTARKSVNWQIYGSFHYAPMRNGQLFVSGGDSSTDFNHEGELHLINSLASLFFGENPIKFYRKKHITIYNRIDLANGFNLSLGGAWENRKAMENKLSYSIFSGPPTPNIPGNQTSYMPSNQVFRYTVGLEYTPRYYYHVERGHKRYAHSAYPTLQFKYIGGLTDKPSITGNFHRLEAGIQQKIRLNPFDNIHYILHAGTFINGENAFFPDFKHFRTNELFVTGNALENSFCLSDNYRYSTNRRWAEAHLNYTSAYLLLKHIPFLQGYMFNESLHAKTLWLPGRNYTEAGYSLGIGQIGRIGVFVGLDKGRYDGVGFTISLPILRNMGLQ